MISVAMTTFNGEKYIEKQIDLRKQAKENKNYELADNIRKELEQQGIYIKDTREGTVYEIKTTIM